MIPWRGWSLISRCGASKGAHRNTEMFKSNHPQTYIHTQSFTQTITRSTASTVVMGQPHSAHHDGEKSNAPQAKIKGCCQEESTYHTARTAAGRKNNNNNTHTTTQRCKQSPHPQRKIHIRNVYTGTAQPRRRGCAVAVPTNSEATLVVGDITAVVAAWHGEALRPTQGQPWQVSWWPWQVSWWPWQVNWWPWQVGR